MIELRILTVIETLGAGGAERALVSLLPALQRRGHSCAVAALTGPLTLASELEAAGIKVHSLDLRHRWDVDRGIRRLAKLARLERYDILHGHLFFGGLYVSASRLLLPQARRAVTFHNLGYDSLPANNGWRRIRKRLDGVLMRRCIDRPIAVSQAVADHYAAHLGVRGTAVVHNGIDIAAVERAGVGDRTTILSELGLDPTADLLVAVGRLVPEKGYPDLLAAIEKLGRTRAGVQLVILGDGPLRAQVETAVQELRLACPVVVAGYRSHDETIAIVACADVLVSASTHEGFAIAIAEAMAVGTPVVATCVGGVPELVADAAVLVRPGDPAAMASAIASLLEDVPRRRDLAERGRRRMAERFGIARIAERLDLLYQDLVTGGAAPGRGAA